MKRSSSVAKFQKQHCRRLFSWDNQQKRTQEPANICSTVSAEENHDRPAARAHGYHVLFIRSVYPLACRNRHLTGYLEAQAHEWAGCKGRSSRKAGYLPDGLHVLSLVACSGESWRPVYLWGLRTPVAVANGGLSQVATV